MATQPIALAHVASVDLFVRRARAVRPDFAPGAADLAIAADIVRSVDGIPLAIELAAARVAVLSPAQIRERLAAPLDVLVHTSDHGRHSSMRRTITDSVDQLDEADRLCLSRCTIFRGGFALAAAEKILGPVLPRLEALCARSLVRAAPTGDGEMRFSLYETIRELAGERLDDAERGALAERHGRAFAALGVSLARPVASGEKILARRRLERDLDNLLFAHANAVERAGREPDSDGATVALQLALTLEWVLQVRGLPLERLRVLDAAIAVAHGPRAEVAEAHLARSRAHQDLGEFEAVRRDLDVAQRLAGESRQPLVQALACARLGEVVELTGATGEARRLFEQALARLHDISGLAGGPPRRGPGSPAPRSYRRREGNL